MFFKKKGPKKVTLKRILHNIGHLVRNVNLEGKSKPSSVSQQVEKTNSPATISTATSPKR